MKNLSWSRYTPFHNHGRGKPELWEKTKKMGSIYMRTTLHLLNFSRIPRGIGIPTTS